MRSPALHHQDFPKEGVLSEQIAILLKYAVRAPSTHNIQPWLFRVSGDTIELWRDMERDLTYADPTGRCAMISLGACFEHLEIASKYFGMFVSSWVNPSPLAVEPIARITITAAQEFDDTLLPLMEAMEGRFNARGQFEQQALPNDLFDQVAKLRREEDVYLDTFVGAKKSGYADLVVQGMHHIHAIKEFRKELSGWIRHNYSDQQDGIPAYTMLAPGLVSFFVGPLIRLYNLGSILGALNKKSIESAPAVVVLSTPTDNASQWFRVGRYFERISLFLNSNDLRSSVYVAAIEDLAVRADLQMKLKDRHLPQFAFTIGKPKVSFHPTPRLSPEERMFIS